MKNIQKRIHGFRELVSGIQKPASVSICFGISDEDKRSGTNHFRPLNKERIKYREVRFDMVFQLGLAIQADSQSALLNRFTARLKSVSFST